MKLRWLVYLLSLAMVLISMPAFAFDHTKIEEFIKLKFSDLHLGVIIQDAETGQTLFEKNSNQAFIPASTTKLFTSLAALYVLGPKYQFDTNLKIKPNTLQEGKLKGNLYFEFSGDPSFSSEDLKSLVHNLKTENIQEIEGNVVIDNTRFEAPFYGWGWSWNSIPWYFSAPVTSVIIDENKVGILLNSNPILGQASSLSIIPKENGARLAKFKVDQNIVTVTEKQANEECEIMIEMDKKNNITAKGCWPQHEKPDTLYLALKNPDELVKQLIAQNLEEDGIKLKGKIIFSKMPPDMKLFAKHSSPTLEILIKKILQDSNNIYSESLLKALGAVRYQKGNFQLGSRALREAISEKTGIQEKEFRLWDGSGASSYNLIKPQQLARVLYTIQKDKDLNILFKESLAVSGQSGTLKDRMKAEKLNGRIIAKTGSLHDTSTLAGYLTTSKNRNLIFVIMANNILSDLPTVNQSINEFCELLIED